MDLFIYNPTYQVWICTAPCCRYAVSPSRLLTHLRKRHRSHPSAATVALCKAALAKMLQQPWVDSCRGPCRQPAPADPPVPGLPVYQGYGCPHCPYIARHVTCMQNHRGKHHQDQDGTRGPGRRRVMQEQALAKVRLANRVVSCQRFYVTCAGSHYFEVTPVPDAPAPRRRLDQPAPTDEELIRARVDQALRAGEMAAMTADGHVPVLDAHPTEASPWLELTRWPEYLRGQDLTAVALLGCPPDPETEPLLVELSASVQRLIDQAYQAIRSGQINEFDQIQINTFHGQPGVWNRPIQIHLRPRTYRRYCQVWQQLICFAWRTSQPDQTVHLRHQFTTAQLAALDQMQDHDPTAITSNPDIHIPLTALPCQPGSEATSIPARGTAAGEA
ncbi:uncharacterized protein BDW70DRAFT_165234 [Aspergillus foveolatus]|uniref:uncharacterized protein n=1 Tax=Aspergillus foveolatus TaxID=210207 RepID=UPI003CCD398F